MKQIDYRYLIIFIIISVTLSIALMLLFKQPEKTSPAITINKKVISQKTLNEMFTKKSRLQDMDGFINSVITKELLIQEALRSGIDKEDSFRKSVQNYYEQSLIKILIDRKYQSLTPEIESKLIDRYIELSDKSVHLTLFTYKQIEDIDKGMIESEEKHSIPFSNLSIEVKYSLLNLKEGEQTKPEMSFRDNSCSVFRLDKIENSESNKKENDTELIKKLLIEQKKEVMISKWLDELKKNANVNIRKGVGNN